MNVLNKSSETLDELTSREWLTVNHLGGYASSTLAGINTRKYHGLLVAAMAAPVRRMVVLSGVQETIHHHGWPFELASSEYPGTVHPEGHQLLRAFDHHPFPRWAYQGEGWTLEKQLRLPQGQNSVVLSYTLQAASEPVEFELRPLFALRGIHELMTQWEGRLTAEPHGPNQWRIGATSRSPEVFFAAETSFTADGCWYLNTLYRREQERGYAAQEDLWMPGVMRWTLKPGQTIHFACATEPIDLDRTLRRLMQENEGQGQFIPAVELSGVAPADETVTPAAASAPQQGAISGETFIAGPPLPTDTVPQAKIIARAMSIWSGNQQEDPTLNALTHATGQFLLRTPGEAGHEPVTRISGNYHWSAPQTRNALIGYSGLLLATGRHTTARTYLQWLAMQMQFGLIPSEWPEDGGAPLYHAADVSLWFIQAVWDYLRYTGDEVTVRRHFLPVIGEILARYALGTNLGIGLDHAGLLVSHAPGLATTWMDAAVDDWVVTPRQGRPVELNALWYNALCIGTTLARRFDQPAWAQQWEYLAQRNRHSFNAQFWHEEAGHCHDVLSEHGRDPELRPNQLLAISLPFPVLEMDRHVRVLRAVREQLLTPMGLRTLGPHVQGYQRRCGHGLVNRQRASHQGTVYPWLLGPYVSALLRVHGRNDSMRRQAMAIIQPSIDFLMSQGLGQMPECFDGEPPHRPGGAMASVASVGTLLKIYVEDVLDRCPPSPLKQPAKPRTTGSGRPEDTQISQA